MKIKAIELYQYLLPLDKYLPVGKQRIDIRKGLVLKIELINKGLDEHLDKTSVSHVEQVEIAPLSGLDIDGNPLTGFSCETLEQVISELELSSPQLIGHSTDTLLALSNKTQLPSLAFGLSLLHAKLNGQLTGHHISPQNLKSVPLIYRAQDEPLSTLQERVRSLAQDIHSVKVKVAQTSLEEEIKLIHEILAIRPDLKLRLDANRGFTLEQAIEFAACLPLHAIEYIEEPCVNPHDNPTFYRAIEMPWALDESLNDPTYQFIMQDGLVALVAKPMLIGSLEKLQSLQSEAEHSGVRFIISSSLESSLGIAALARLSQVMTPDEIPGLDTLSAFSADILVCSGKSRLLSWDALTLIHHWQ